MKCDSTAHPNGSEDFEAKVNFLRRPESYPEHTAAVEVVATHMSCVFLTDNHAYKMKRPVRFDYLDFSTLEARYRDCLEEVRLNRRLARDVYLGLTSITARPDGGLTLGGDGEVVEWLVKMRRLPRARMLDQVIQRSEVQADDIRRCARVLVEFYRRALPVALEGDEYRGRLENSIHANHLALSDPLFSLDAASIERIATCQLGMLNSAAELFDRRVGEGRIVEGHGDLRPEHVCLGAEPLFIDCLEFNREFRIVDPVDELGHLALECEFAGATAIGEVLFATYREESGDDPPARLIDFYRSCRAMLRAKLSIWHVRDHEAREHGKWTARAHRYLRLAERYAQRAG